MRRLLFVLFLAILLDITAAYLVEVSIPKLDANGMTPDPTSLHPVQRGVARDVEDELDIDDPWYSDPHCTDCPYDPTPEEVLDRSCDAGTNDVCPERVVSYTQTRLTTPDTPYVPEFPHSAKYGPRVFTQGVTPNTLDSPFVGVPRANFSDLAGIPAVATAQARQIWRLMCNQYSAASVDCYEGIFRMNTQAKKLGYADIYTLDQLFTYMSKMPIHPTLTHLSLSGTPGTLSADTLTNQLDTNGFDPELMARLEELLDCSMPNVELDTPLYDFSPDPVADGRLGWNTFYTSAFPGDSTTDVYRATRQALRRMISTVRNGGGNRKNLALVHIHARDSDNVTEAEVYRAWKDYVLDRSCGYKPVLHVALGVLFRDNDTLVEAEGEGFIGSYDEAPLAELVADWEWQNNFSAQIVKSPRMSWSIAQANVDEGLVSPNPSSVVTNLTLLFTQAQEVSYDQYIRSLRNHQSHLSRGGMDTMDMVSIEDRIAPASSLLFFLGVHNATYKWFNRTGFWRTSDHPVIRCNLPRAVGGTPNAFTGIQIETVVRAIDLSNYRWRAPADGNQAGSPFHFPTCDPGSDVPNCPATQSEDTGGRLGEASVPGSDLQAVDVRIQN